ncbi:chymotrypsin-like serine proteinase [Littorina saxatilis]|uniref:chymotrypsin-like serine proteinase n=1 Tax=Littorina saxatilis TaxID=31220 RepID=UPI0038B4FC18
MKWMLLFAVLVAAAKAEVGQRIVGGEVATYGEHPYICSLQQGVFGLFWSHICGAVIYSNTKVVTAAHCLDGQSASSLRLLCGIHHITQTDQHQVTVNVERFTNHPSYDGSAPGYPNDIGVIKTQTPIVFNSHVNSIPFATDGDFTGQTCKLSGWGRVVGGGSTATLLKKVNMQSISSSDCRNRWSSVQGANIDDQQHICFFAEDKSACNGDSGGPVRCGGTLTGITSWGISSCDGTYPSVYTRVSSYINWIDSLV